MKKYISAFLIFLLLIGSFTLKDYSEIEQVAIASSIYFEESFDGYFVSVQIVKNYDEENQSVSAKGKTLEECLSRIDSVLIKKLSLSHCGVALINKNCNSSVLCEILTFLKDYKNFPLSAYIVFAENTDFSNIDYSLSEYITNKNKAYPLYEVMNKAYSEKIINLPVIKAVDYGYTVTETLEKEVLF